MWARIFKVGVEKFYLFFDAYNFAFLRWNKEGLHICDFIHFPRLVNPSKTEYGIGWIPLGGYCAIAGMVDETHTAEDIKDMEGDDLFMKKGKFAQFMIMVGGVLNNIILAVLIYIGMSWHWGKDILEPHNLPWGYTYSEFAHSIGFQEGDELVAIDGEKLVDMASVENALLLANDVTVYRAGAYIDIVLPDTLGTYFLTHKSELLNFVTPCAPFVAGGFVEGSPAQQAGLQVGDSIVMVDSVALPFFHLVRNYMSERPEQTVQVSFYRSGVDSLQTLAVTLDANGKMGVYPKPVIGPECLTHIDFTLAEAIPDGCRRGWNMLYNYVRQFKLVFTKEGAQELGGFGTMGSIFPDTWNWKLFWGLTAFISVALAFMNILPIPALDGGHIMILIIEAIIRRPLSDKFKERLQFLGFAFILLLMVAVNANDILKFFF
ncbi:MAG: RIP metalloprotease RseP [Bacteroidales bacterium]|nr:RIP metalloprotease RseP [Bacteroidales bacterium]